MTMHLNCARQMASVKLRRSACHKNLFRRLVGEALEPRVVFDVSPMVTSTSPDQVWDTVASIPVVEGKQSYIQPSAYTAATLDRSKLAEQVAQAPLEFTQLAETSAVEITLPTPTGGYARFNVVASPIMEPALAAQFPEIQTYSGQGIDDPAATLRFDITPVGFHAQVLSPLGAYYIDPYYHLDDSVYVSYYKQDLQPRAGMEFVEQELHDHDDDALDAVPVKGSDKASAGSSTTFVQPPSLDLSADQLKDTGSSWGLSKDTDPPMLARAGTQLRTYRLANAATGEYTAFHGGTVALGQAAIVTAVNRITGIYENELSVRLVLVANNSLLVYTNAATDPYSNTNPSSLLTQNQTNIDTVIGNANYDIGHVFSTGGGGLAGLGVVGVTGQKARGETGLGAPIGDAFYVDYVAHEMGHQFGGSHTFNSPNGSCAGNRSASAAYEPGSGSTIQAYAGICGVDDLQPNSDPYFHSFSFDQILNYTTTGAGNAAAAITSTGNSVPRINAGLDFVIPSRTPFVLSGAGVDANSTDVLSYNWEQRDLGPSVSLAAADNGTSPLFRSFNPTTSPERVLPRLNELLNNTAPVGEKLPTLSRTMHFRATVRDNRSGGGGVNSDDMIVTVVDTGAAFAVTSPNTAVGWTSGSTQTVTWNVAGTTAAPISTAAVNIWLSVDGGQTFTIQLAANTPNDGSQSITVPNIFATQARVKVEAANSIYFDVSNANFLISGNSNTAPTLSPINNRMIDMGQSTGDISFTVADTQTAAASLIVSATASNSTLLPSTGIVLGGSGSTRTINLTPAAGQFGVTTVFVNVTDADGITATESFQLFVEGVLSCSPFQTFDGVTAPNLPSGWTVSSSGVSAVNWVTSSTSSDSGANNAFVSDPDNISNSLLTSPSFAVSESNRRVQFRNNFNLETGFDGGVLEISINGGAFTDFVTAGGLFVTGGYTATIATGFSSPIANRLSWTGSSGGYITTVAELPASALGQNVQLRFRMASDDSTSGVGWRVDTIQTCGYAVPSVISITATDASKSEGNTGTTPFTFTVSRTGDTSTAISVQYAVTGSGATPAVADDFGAVLPSGTVSFAAGEANKVLTINVVGDTQAEPSEGFAVTLSSPTGNSSILTTTANGTILNDDNAPPAIAANLSNVVGNVLSTLTNTGTWSDPELDTVTLSASLGVVVRNNDGTWSWSHMSTTRLDGTLVTITASDGTSNSTASFTVTAAVNVVSTGMYYKGSSFASSSVAAAIPTNKSLAHAGANPQTLSYTNVINNTRGINGLVINAAGLVATTLNASDFTFKMSPQGAFNEAANPPSSWATAPVPSAIVVTPGVGATPAQIRVEWADNVIVNRWLQIKILANANTGLPSNEVYYIGHLRGELNGQILAGAYFVTNADLAMINPIGGVANVDSNRDVDKNGFVLNSDGLVVRSSIVSSLSLRNITIPAAGSPQESRSEFELSSFKLATGAESLKLGPVIASLAARDSDVEAKQVKQEIVAGSASSPGVLSAVYGSGVSKVVEPSRLVTDTAPPKAQSIDAYFDALDASLEQDLSARFRTGPTLR